MSSYEYLKRLETEFDQECSEKCAHITQQLEKFRLEQQNLTERWQMREKQTLDRTIQALEASIAPSALSEEKNRFTQRITKYLQVASSVDALGSSPASLITEWKEDTSQVVPTAIKCDPHHCPRCRTRFQRKDSYGICPACKHVQTIMDTQLSYDDKHNTAATSYVYERMGNLAQQLSNVQCKQSGPPLWLCAETMMTLVRQGHVDRTRARLFHVKAALKQNGRSKYYRFTVKLFCTIYGHAPLRFSYSMETFMMNVASAMMDTWITAVGCKGHAFATEAQNPPSTTTAAAPPPPPPGVHSGEKQPRIHFMYKLWMFAMLWKVFGIRRSTMFLHTPVHMKRRDAQLQLFNSMSETFRIAPITLEDLDTSGVCDEESYAGGDEDDDA